jgi:hypothetical protein
MAIPESDAVCQLLTHAAQQTIHTGCDALFDHLVGTRKQ